MKRYGFLILIIMTLITSCAPANVRNNDNLSIVCTSFPSYDFARNITADKADVTLLVPAGTDSHSYDPKPMDIITVENCDILICNGGESETWVNKIIDSLNNSEVKIIYMTESVETVVEELTEGMEGEVHGDIDEHVWTSPVNAKLICRDITKALCEIAPEYASIFEKNLLEYSEELDAVDALFWEAVADGVRNTVVFGDRFPFRYLADEYGLDYYAAFPGCSEMTEPAAKTVSFLIDKVKSESIPVVFYVEFSNHQICDTICSETGAKPTLLHSCHNLTKSEFDSGASYISLMTKNAEVLKEALSHVTA